MFFAGKKLKNSLKRNKITVWLMLVVILAAMLPLMAPAYAEGSGGLSGMPLAAGANHTVAVDGYGTVWAWGEDLHPLQIGFVYLFLES